MEELISCDPTELVCFSVKAQVYSWYELMMEHLLVLVIYAQRENDKNQFALSLHDIHFHAKIGVHVLLH